jgi:hypothetical protein
MSIWLKDGKLVVDSSKKPIECADCPCDAVDCNYYVGDFSVDQDPLDTDDWTESAGDWAIASGLLTTSSDNARVRMDIAGTPINRTIDNIHMQVKFKLSASGGEFVIGSKASSDSSLSLVLIRASGTAKAIARNFGGSPTYYDHSVTAASGTIHTLLLDCGKVSLNGTYLFNITRATSATDLYIGTESLAGGSLEVSELIVYKDASLGPDASCTTCITCPNILQNEPATIDVDVAGFFDFTIIANFYELSNLNGTYTLSKCSASRASGCVYTLSGLSIQTFDDGVDQHYITTARLSLGSAGNAEFSFSSEPIVSCNHNVRVECDTLFSVDPNDTDTDVSDNEFTLVFRAHWDVVNVLTQPEPGITAKIQL